MVQGDVKATLVQIPYTLNKVFCQRTFFLTYVNFRVKIYLMTDEMYERLDDDEKLRIHFLNDLQEVNINRRNKFMARLRYTAWLPAIALVGCLFLPINILLGFCIGLVVFGLSILGMVMRVRYLDRQSMNAINCYWGYYNRLVRKYPF